MYKTTKGSIRNLVDIEADIKRTQAQLKKYREEQKAVRKTIEEIPQDVYIMQVSLSWSAYISLYHFQSKDKKYTLHITKMYLNVKDYDQFTKCDHSTGIRECSEGEFIQMYQHVMQDNYSFICHQITQEEYNQLINTVWSIQGTEAFYKGLDFMYDLICKNGTEEKKADFIRHLAQDRSLTIYNDYLKTQGKAQLIVTAKRFKGGKTDAEK